MSISELMQVGLVVASVGRLLALPPDERLLAIVYLRRSGLLRGEAFAPDDILRPATQADEAAQ